MPPTTGPVHVVGTYYGAEGAPLTVTVGPTEAPITLVLCAYYFQDWRLDLKERAKLGRVIVAGYNAQRIEDLAKSLPAGVPLDVYTYYPTKGARNDTPRPASFGEREYFWASKAPSEEHFDLIDKIKALTGREIDSFVGEYKASSFVVGGDGVYPASPRSTVQEQRRNQAVKANKPAVESAVSDPPPYPVVVESVPESGAADVDPGLTEVRVTFDRDMSIGGYSWTGNEKTFMPSVPEGAQPKWLDKRTCVLPVTLREGEFYRVGINAKSAQNFKSAEGVPAAHEAIAFATKGAKRSVALRTRVPRVVKLFPEQNAEAVDPATTSLRVTFDTAMAPGMSWTKAEGGLFPESAGEAIWSRDGKTCTLPVRLEPGKTYAVGLNHAYYTNFQTKWFVPLKPLVWKFTTADKAVE